MSVHLNAPQDGNPNSKTFEEVYELGKEIGNGAFGSVHIAHHRGGGNDVAVKVIDRSKLKGKDNQVIRETQTLRELGSHPNIVSLVDFFSSSESFNVVLELARGGDLFDKLSQRKVYTEGDARSVAKDILTAVSYIHSKGFVHRDLKPENLLLVDGGEGVKVADFGFAKNISDAPTPDGLVTRCGTPSYVAPELVNATPYGTPVDVWSCGVILFMLLGGYQPFHADDGQKLFRQILSADYEFIKKYWGPISVEAKQLITRMLAIDPKARITANDALNSSWMAISDSDMSISSRNLESTIKGFQNFNGKRKLKGAMHLANIVRKLPFWNSRRSSFMSSDTTTSKTEPESKKLEGGKISQKFDDIYSLVSEVSEKGNTTVWKGLRKKNSELLAIKVIRRENSALDDADVLNEVAILNSLRHKYVVQIHDYFEESSRFLLVMEFVPGGDVFDSILKNVKYTESNAQELSRALITAIQYIHSCSIAHRDLKPQNLLLETNHSDSRLKIADFGFARRVHSPLSLTTRCGTPTYVAPEILKNHPHDESADMWSVGVILYVLLIGYPPFMEKRQRDLFQKIRRGIYNFEGEDWTGVSSQAKDLIRSLLVVDPARRFSAEKALQHDWFCNADEETLSMTSLLGSQRSLLKSMEITSSPDIPEDAPWVTSVTPLV